MLAQFSPETGFRKGADQYDPGIPGQEGLAGEDSQGAYRSAWLFSTIDRWGIRANVKTALASVVELEGRETSTT